MQTPGLADIIRRFGQSFILKHHPNTWQLRTLDAIAKCRTSALGGHKYRCSHCGKEHISYNSCRNRHCPQCQGAKNAFWVEERTASVLAVKHYHIVFTVPEALNGICMLDSRWFYDHMFTSAWETLRQMSYTHYGVESGAIAVLHTWGQNLSLHPHIHCIVPAAGVTVAGNMKYIGKAGKYLYPVTMLSGVFRGKLMESLKSHPLHYTIDTHHKEKIRQAWQKPWVVFCEPSFGKPDHVIGYLGQYIHRIAISNNRIVQMTEQAVTFRVKDYDDGEKIKPVTLKGEEFLRRFCLHILPRRFVRIRYYGIYSSRFRHNAFKPDEKMVIKVRETVAGRIERLTCYNVLLCPVCKKGILIPVAVIPRARAPSAVFEPFKNHSSSCHH